MTVREYLDEGLTKDCSPSGMEGDSSTSPKARQWSIEYQAYRKKVYDPTAETATNSRDFSPGSVTNV